MTQELVAAHTDCEVLKQVGFRQMRLPGGYKTAPYVNNNIVSLKRACVFNPTNPVCTSQTPASTTRQVQGVHRMISRAQGRGMRDYEEALRRKAENENRQNRANCSHIMEALEEVSGRK